MLGAEDRTKSKAKCLSWGSLLSVFLTQSRISSCIQDQTSTLSDILFIGSVLYKPVYPKYSLYFLVEMLFVMSEAYIIMPYSFPYEE